MILNLYYKWKAYFFALHSDHKVFLVATHCLDYVGVWGRNVIGLCIWTLDSQLWCCLEVGGHGTFRRWSLAGGSSSLEVDFEGFEPLICFLCVNQNVIAQLLLLPPHFPWLLLGLFPPWWTPSFWNHKRKQTLSWFEWQLSRVGTHLWILSHWLVVMIGRWFSAVESLSLGAGIELQPLPTSALFSAFSLCSRLLCLCFGEGENLKCLN